MREDRAERQDVIAMQRIYLQVAILKATSLCLRGRAHASPPAAKAYPEALEDCRMAAARTAPREPF
eukprot:NODE_2314_length_1151_cov_20.441924_g1921_i0.p8 GENE.NODE_2314_length_1151_cov_20.441924_g1921_i0~~NODE_2314_length_1151_cov_20.441924_g1921_i0.p8  ORF type:complete len:66 (-),score=13.57 NODE_2314_length_1151_cov_20.441924_g1921_i0:279-476(-)